MNPRYIYRSAKTGRFVTAGDSQVIAGDPEAPLTGVSDEQLDARINALLARELG